jgi:CRP-like cAMP-binding protein
MSELSSVPANEATKRPHFVAAAAEALLAGRRSLRQAFLSGPTQYADRGAPLGRQDGTEPQILLIRNGFAYRSCVLADGRRAILDILTTGDIIGLDDIVFARPVDEFTAACRLGYNALGAGEVRLLMTDQPVSLQVFALLAEARWRANRLAISIGRLDAQARICLLLLDIYNRLVRRGVLNRPTFNLPLTQEQIADHLGLTVVHVNRTLRRLREDRLVMLDRQVVIILDLERLREMARGLPQPADIYEPAEHFDALPAV